MGLLKTDEIKIGKVHYSPAAIVDLRIEGNKIISKSDFGEFLGKLEMKHTFFNDEEAKNAFEKLEKAM